MVLLASMVVEYVADTSKLVSGVAAAATAQKTMQDAAGVATSSMSQGYKGISSDIQAFTVRAEAAGLNVSRLTTLQLNAGAASARLGVAQATAAEAMKKASDMATAGTASAEKIAVAQARAQLASERVAVAQNAEAVAMQKVQAEAARLQVEMDGVTASTMTASEAASTIGVAFAAVMAVVAAVGVVTTKMAGDFESGITTLETGAGELHNNLQMVGDGILAMAPAVGTTTQQLIAGMFNIESSGQRGEQALLTLKMAAEGAKVGAADLGATTLAVATEMNDYASTGLTAAEATNTLIATVKNGMTHMQDLADSIHTVLPTAAAAGVSLTDVSAAMATMTAAGVPAADAATYLRQTIMSLENPTTQAADTMKSFGLSASALADEMKVSLPGALQMITDAVGKKFPAGSQEYIAAIANIVGGTKSMQGILDLTGSHMDVFKANVTSIATAVKQGGDSIVGWSTIQSDFNQKMDRAKATIETFGIAIGTMLLPYAGKLLDAFQQLVQVGGQVVSFFQHNQIAMTALQVVLIPVAGAIGGLLVFALLAAASAAWTFAAGVIAATWPFLLIGAAIAALAAGLLFLYNNFLPFHNLVNSIGQAFLWLWGVISTNFIPVLQKIGNLIQTYVMPVLQQIGAYIAAQFAPVWQQLVVLWQTQIVPILQQLGTAFASLMPSIVLLKPLLQALGIIIGVYLVAHIAVLIGFITGLAHGLATFLSGLITFASGFIQFFTGMAQFISGVTQLIHDILTGNFGRIRADLGTIWLGTQNMFAGGWKMIVGLFQMSIGTILSFVQGFASGVVTFAMALVSGFTGQIAQLPGRAAGIFNSLVSMVLGILNGLASSAFNAGATIISQIANGIRAGIANVSGAINDVAAFIAAHLPHSAARIGPLRDLALQGSEIVSQVSKGMMAGLPQLETALGAVTRPISLSFGTSASAKTPSSLPSSNSRQQGQPIVIILDGRQVGKGVIPYVGPELAKELRAVLK